jgi:hypothetical protein
MGHDGLVLGIDLALEIPLASADVGLETPLPMNDPAAQAAYNIAKAEIQEVADDVISLLPFLVQLNLIRIGYIF